MLVAHNETQIFTFPSPKRSLTHRSIQKAKEFQLGNIYNFLVLVDFDFFLYSILDHKFIHQVGINSSNCASSFDE